MVRVKKVVKEIRTKVVKVRFKHRSDKLGRGGGKMQKEMASIRKKFHVKEVVGRQDKEHVK